MAFDNIIKVLEDIGQHVIESFKADVEKKNGSASGSMVSSTMAEITITDQKITLTVSTVPYFQYADEGRGKTVNNGPGEVKKKIRKWIDQKGITPSRGTTKDQLAFLMARKIHREGFKGKYYRRDIITDSIQQNADLLLADAIKKDFNF